MKKAGSGSTRQGERGAVAAEFAVLGPLLVIIFVVVVDLGFMVWEYEILQNAAGVGARHSALPEHQVSRSAFGPNEERRAIKLRVIDYLKEEGITVTEDQIEIDQEYPINFTADESRTVYGSEVRINYTRPLLLGAAFLGLNNVTLRARSVFANFY